MIASQYGYLEVVHTLLEAKADVIAQNNVRNQMMMMMIMIIIILLNILMMMVMIMMITMMH